MKIIIIEDEKPSARLLQRKIEKLGYQIEAMIHSVEEGLNYFQDHTMVDLILADIQLSDGLSFEIFETLNLSTSIIFTTAYDEYALKAFKLNSIDYLLKPIDDDELKNAIEKFHKQQPKIDVELFKRFYPKQQNYKQRFTFKIGQNIKIVDITEVDCIFSENKLTYFHTISDKNYVFDGSLESLMDQLNPNQFFRINRQQIVQLDHIVEIKIYQQTRLKLYLTGFKDEVIVSRERVQDFKNWIA